MIDFGYIISSKKHFDSEYFLFRAKGANLCVEIVEDNTVLVVRYTENPTFYYKNSGVVFENDDKTIVLYKKPKIIIENMNIWFDDIDTNIQIVIKNCIFKNKIVEYEEY